jgi:hypothetical protein
MRGVHGPTATIDHDGIRPIARSQISKCELSGRDDLSRGALALEATVRIDESADAELLQTLCFFPEIAKTCGLLRCNNGDDSEVPGRQSRRLRSNSPSCWSRTRISFLRASKISKGVFRIDRVDLEAESVLRLEYWPGTHEQLDAGTNRGTRCSFELRQQTRGGAGSDHCACPGNWLACTVPLCDLELHVAVAHSCFLTSTKVQTPLANACATADATPPSSRDSAILFLTLAKPAPEGSWIAGPEVLSAAASTPAGSRAVKAIRSTPASIYQRLREQSKRAPSALAASLAIGNIEVLRDIDRDELQIWGVFFCSKPGRVARPVR